MLKARICLLVPGGAAKPNPKMGQALGPLGINMAQFCKELNEKTADFRNDVPLRIKMNGTFHFNQPTLTEHITTR